MQNKKPSITPWMAGIPFGLVTGALVMWFYLHDVLVPKVSVEPGSIILSIMHPNGENERCSSGPEFIKLLEVFAGLKSLKTQPIRESDEKQMQGLLSYRMYPIYNLEPFDIAVIPGIDMQDKLSALYQGKRSC